LDIVQRFAIYRFSPFNGGGSPLGIQKETLLPAPALTLIGNEPGDINECYAIYRQIWFHWPLADFELIGKAAPCSTPAPRDLKVFDNLLSTQD
jgi:hypothetical protein